MTIVEINADKSLAKDLDWVTLNAYYNDNPEKLSKQLQRNFAMNMLRSKYIEKWLDELIPDEMILPKEEK